jgi:hypothetical protein
MKHCILFLVLLVYGQSRADGLDKITVYINGKEVFDTNTSGPNATIRLDSLHIGDTIEFRAWTDWSPLVHSTLLFQTEDGKRIRKLQQYDHKRYRATFLYIVDKPFLQQETCFVFHYDEGPVEYWDFAFTDFNNN